MNKIFLIPTIFIVALSSCNKSDRTPNQTPATIKINYTSTENNKESNSKSITASKISEDDYINKTVALLKEFKPRKDEKYLIEQIGNKYLLHGGYIPFTNGGWIYCISHSFHDEEVDNIIIGDLNMAIDNNGKIYTNRGHLCEGCAFWTVSPKGLSSIDDIFQSNSNEKTSKWKIYIPSSNENNE